VVLLLGLGCVLGDPDVFDNYFDDELRFVDVNQEVVLKACLPNGDDTVKKIQKAYDKCFGEDYSFDDLADTVGRDSDNDDLPDEYEGNEACFYKTMDWVKGKEVQPSVIEDDMAGLPDFDSFKDNINSCSTWSGNFGGRKKRAVGEASEDTEEVPSIMDSGSGALQWVRSLVRRARSAEPGKGDGQNKAKGNGKGKKGKKGNKGKGKKGRKNNVRSKKGGKGKNRNGKARKGGKKGVKGGKKRAKKGGKKGGKKNRNNKKKNNRGNKKQKKEKKDNKGKKGKKDRKNEKKNNNKEEKKDKKNDKKKEGRSGKSSDLLPDFVYNKLWCFDLAMEQALEKCVEDKLNN